MGHRPGFHPTWTHFIDETLPAIEMRLGRTIYDPRCGKNWDVGQAVCAEAYGPDWMNSQGFLHDNELPVSEPVPQIGLDAAQRILTQDGWWNEKESKGDEPKGCWECAKLRRELRIYRRAWRRVCFFSGLGPVRAAIMREARAKERKRR